MSFQAAKESLHQAAEAQKHQAAFQHSKNVASNSQVPVMDRMKAGADAVKEKVAASVSEMRHTAALKGVEHPKAGPKTQTHVLNTIPLDNLELESKSSGGISLTVKDIGGNTSGDQPPITQRLQKRADSLSKDEIEQELQEAEARRKQHLEDKVDKAKKLQGTPKRQEDANEGLTAEDLNQSLQEAEERRRRISEDRIEKAKRLGERRASGSSSAVQGVDST